MTEPLTDTAAFLDREDERMKFYSRNIGSVPVVTMPLDVHQRLVALARKGAEPAGTPSPPMCATCRHWTAERNAHDIPLVIGRCAQGVRQGRPSNDLGSGLYTAQSFGCSLHAVAPQERT